ncbi:MAG: hypothetical protein Q9208_003347 [Pyrenodesmia sp. 3 TL-2023]
MASLCTALNVSDESRCKEAATSLNGLFCSFHSRQCQGLYRGYKIRNARLDALDTKPPHFLATSTTPLANQTFAQVEAEDTLHEMHDYLGLKYALLERVIRARKLHHSRFFSLHLDYGHQNYLDQLSSRRFTVLRALERLERRAVEVLYNKKKWFKWVRECQDEEETARENDKKKVKKEAALFKRYNKEVQARMRELKAKEDLKRQEAYLDEVYNSRLSEEEQEAEWDPIEDVIEDERGNYIDLIKHILLLTESVDDAGKTDPPREMKEIDQNIAATTTNTSKKAKKNKSRVITDGPDTVPVLPDKSAHDTKSQVRKRLSEGVKLEYSAGWHVAGTVDNPAETLDKTAAIPDDEIDKLLEDMAEIKHLLFCRLLLSHATVLPAAISSNMVDEFLNHKDVTDADLRDLALKLDSPGLQEIRDACADLGRGEEEADDVYEEPEDEPEIDKTEERLQKLGLSNKTRKYAGMPNSWATTREKQITSAQQERQSLVDHSGGFGFGGVDKEAAEHKLKPMIDFGELDDENNFKSKKMRVRVCGRYIYNYPSERAISRGGWLQFCLIAKDSDLHDAIKLCRHWDEFFDLNILSIFQYFPAAKWLVWKGDRHRQQLLQLGLVPYLQFEEAEEISSNFKSGSSRGQGRRVHSIVESRNWLCANIRRDDPATRRFLQYLVMRTSRVVVLIRDVKTSKILSTPPADQLWLHREKAGIGRASKNEWFVRAAVGPEFFEKMERMREWHFGFNDYYDVYIWDLKPGKPWASLFNTVYETLVKAHRFCEMRDMYNPAAHILKTLTRDPVTFRTRDIRPGEEVTSIWDETRRARFRLLNPRGRPRESTAFEEDPSELDSSYFYGEPDVLEDEVLFPEELSTETSKALYSGKASALDDFVHNGPNWERFIQDLDTDEEMDSDDDIKSDDNEYTSEDESGDDEPEADEGKGGHRLLENPNEERDDSEEDDDLPLETRRGDDDRSQSAFSKELADELFEKMFSANEKEDMAVMANWKPPRDFRENVKADFMMFMDREKSKVFKRSWHAADLSPEGPERHREAQAIVHQMVKFYRHGTDRFKHLRTVRFMDVHPDQHRRIVPDAQDAHAMAMLFFPSDFLSSEYGVLHKDSLLFLTKERALNPPPRRSWVSDKYKPASFWDEWMAYWKQAKYEDDYPVEWDIVIRPIVAKLYKAGIIGPTYESSQYIPGKAMAAPGADGKRDLYIDLRCIEDAIIFPRHIQRPPPKESLFTSMRAFVVNHPNARFSALRLWSAPHFYPLMNGLDKRHLTGFTDALGRAWEWNFVCKDMPYSEISMHHTVSGRLDRFRRQLGDRVLHMRDLLIVMGTDEQDLLKYTTAAIFAVQTEPWRLEIDLWRSFINVDLDFLDWLDGLKKDWLD